MKEPERTICTECFKDNNSCIESLDCVTVGDGFVENYCRELRLRKQQKEIEKLKAALEEIANGHLQEKVSESIAVQALKELEE